MDATETRALTAPEVQSAVREALTTSHDLSPCQRICEGGEHNVWQVGHDLILRGLPSSEQSDGRSEASLKRDAAVCDLLRRYLSNSDWAPQVHTRIVIGGWICNVERRVHGKSLEVVEPTGHTERALVQVLKDLASVPIEEAREAVAYQEWLPDMNKHVNEACQAWDELVQERHVVDPDGRARNLLIAERSIWNAVQISETVAVLTHADISGEHILVNEESGELNGIIDWSDAVVGDPCRDIAGLSLAVGQMISRRIGTAAGYSKHTVEKGLLYAICLAIQNLRNRLCRDEESPLGLLKSQLSRTLDGMGVDIHYI